MPDARTDVHNKRNYLFLNDNFFKFRALRKEGTPVSRDGPDGHDSIFPTPFSSLLRRTSRNTA